MLPTLARYSHFYPLHLDAPRVRRLVQAVLHVVRDTLPFTQDLGQVFRTENVTERGGGQQARGVAGYRRRGGGGLGREKC